MAKSAFERMVEEDAKKFAERKLDQPAEEIQPVEQEPVEEVILTPEQPFSVQNTSQGYLLGTGKVEIDSPFKDDLNIEEYMVHPEENALDIYVDNGIFFAEITVPLEIWFSEFHSYRMVYPMPQLEE